MSLHTIAKQFKIADVLKIELLQAYVEIAMAGLTTVVLFIYVPFYSKPPQFPLS